ncbi:cyclic nucleotide-binding domain-containing protein [Aquabacterium sp.]|uniref:cyclic nucleotide-binding domain-containing protein n=1 Tax=Aquabacterium sp. TaxID=1872578 RepID=UPI003783F981
MSLEALVAEGVARLGETAAAVLASPLQLVAHLAAAIAIAMVVAGALCRTMLPLRWLAVGSNLGLLVYGALHPSPITLLIAASLLPINLYRAVELTRLSRRVKGAGVAADMAALWLRPHMKARRFNAGQTLFNKGDKADSLYLLAEGRLALAGIGAEIAPGRIFGEIALFSAEHRRTQTVRCVTACTVLQIHESTVRQLFYQNPAFAFHLMAMLAQGLGKDVERALATGPLRRPMADAAAAAEAPAAPEAPAADAPVER